MSEEDFKEKMFDKLDELTEVVRKGFTDSDKRMDKQDTEISDIKDQIKGNPDKDIKGIVVKIRELYSVLVVPIFIKKIPNWIKWGLASLLIANIPADMNNHGVISFVKFLFHNFKP